mgnify:CR=1 FL=1
MKKDTRYLVSVALMAAIVILLANTPLGMIQLPIIKATTVHIPVIIGAILLGPSAGAILGAIFGICSLISNTTAPTLLSFAFSVSEYNRSCWRGKSDLDLGWMPHYDRRDLRMALDLISKTESEFLSFPYHHWFCRFDGKYDICYGQYLSALCRTVCRCQRCGTHRGVRPDHGYGHCIRHPGSDCCRNPCHCHHKSTAEGCS